MKDGYYTFDEIATMTGVSLNGLYKRFNKYIDKSKVRTERIGKGTNYLLTIDQIKELGLLQEKKPAATKAEADFTELKKLHPLIKDVRLFKTSFFPDVVPECFKENKNVEGGKK